MLVNLTYLAASVAAIVCIVKAAPGPAAAVTLCVVLVGLLAVLASLSRDPDDLVRVIGAVTDLVRGRPDT